MTIHGRMYPKVARSQSTPIRGQRQSTKTDISQRTSFK